MFLLIGRSIHWIRSKWYLSRMMEAWLRTLRALFVFSLSQAKASYFSSDSGSSASIISLIKWIMYARTSDELHLVLQETRRNDRLTRWALRKKMKIRRRIRK